MNVFSQVVVGHHVPYAVAGEHEELVLVVHALSGIDLGLGRHELLARTAALHALVLVVAEGARDGERAVDALYHDRAAGVLYALALDRIDRLVVVGGEHDRVIADEDGARVAAVDEVDVRRTDKAGDGRRAALVLAAVELGHPAHLLVEVEETLANGLFETRLVDLRVAGRHYCCTTRRGRCCDCFLL